MSVVDEPGTHAPVPSEPERWLRLLPRWSLLTGLVAVLFLVVFAVFVGPAEADARLGDRYIEFFQAVRATAAYRLQMVLDAVIWALNGGLFLVFAGLLRRRTPIVSVLLGALGVGHVVGVVGGLLRLNGTGFLASQFAGAGAEQQAVLLEQFLTVDVTMRALFHAGNLLQGPAFLLAAWALFSLAGFPRWLSIWLAVPGVLVLTRFVVRASGVVMPTAPPPIIVAVVIVSLPLYFVMAKVLWRPHPTLISEVRMLRVRPDRLDTGQT